VKIVGIKERCC